MEHNTDYFGFDLNDDCNNQPTTWRRESPSECYLLCQQADGFELFTWIGADHSWIDGRKRCCLKHQANATSTFQEGVVSGPKACGNYSVMKK